MRRATIVIGGLLFLVLAGCLTPGNAEPTAVPVPPVDTTVVPTAPSVAILVIDDFRPADQPRDGSPPASGNCAVTPDGQGHFSGGGLGHFSGGGLGHFSGGGLGPAANTSHGEMVFGKLRELINAAYGLPFQEIADAQPVNPDLRAVSLWQADNRTLVLAGVDTQGFDTSSLAGRIEGAMKTVENEWGASQFVLNMSFGLIPCDFEELSADEYRELIKSAINESVNSPPDPDPNPLLPLQELIDGLDRILESGYIDREAADSILIGKARLTLYYLQGPEIVFEQTTQGGGDALFNFIQEPPYGRENVISVAAAGNSNLAYPFAPAMWPGVLAVGAEPPYANDSEVVMFDQYTLPGAAITVDGTSFSAPEMSFQMAVRLLRGGTGDCAGAAGPTNPPLSYADETGPWRNLDLAAASVEFCDPFPR